VVSKQTGKSGATLSRVRPVQDQERVAEVARMLGGEKISDTTLAHAREMLDQAGSRT
jgi:DNA repair protein RecN (Recombination protein N)